MWDKDKRYTSKLNLYSPSIKVLYATETEEEYQARLKQQGLPPGTRYSVNRPIQPKENRIEPDIEDEP